MFRIKYSGTLSVHLVHEKQRPPQRPEVDPVSSEIQRCAQKHEERLHHHENVEAIQLLDNMGTVRRLQRKKNPLS
jgi:hypothetical protein